jgi:hypothetical protein
MFVYLHKTPLLWDVNFPSLVDKACDQLAGTSIVKDLLSLATRDDLSDEIKQNVAIALAKLVKRDLRYVFLE